MLGHIRLWLLFFSHPNENNLMDFPFVADQTKKCYKYSIP
jgi:hypothetical protein